MLYFHCEMPAAGLLLHWATLFSQYFETRASSSLALDPDLVGPDPAQGEK